MARSSLIINDGSKIKHSIKYVLVKHFSFTPVVQVMFQQQLVETNIFIQVAQFSINFAAQNTKTTLIVIWWKHDARVLWSS